MMARPQALRCAALAAVAASLAVCALPAHAASETCSFRSRTLAIGVPDLRPEKAADIDLTIPGFQVGDCASAVLLQVHLDDGHNPANGRRRMKHATRPAYLPYTLSPGQPGGTSSVLSSPVRGPGRSRYISQSLRLQIRGADIADLPAGDYSDCVTLTVTP